MQKDKERKQKAKREMKKRNDEQTFHSSPAIKRIQTQK